MKQKYLTELTKRYLKRKSSWDFLDTGKQGLGRCRLPKEEMKWERMGKDARKCVFKRARMRERKVSPEEGREESMEDVEHKNEKATRARNRTPEQEMCNRKKLKYNLVKTRKKKERERNGKSGRARKSERSSEEVVVLAEQKTRNERRSEVKRTWHELREEDEPHREGSKIGTR